MKSEITIESMVTDGHLTDGVRLQIAQAIKQMEGKRVRIKISEAKKRRSHSQNSFYWGVVVPAVIQMFADGGADIDPDQCHDYLKKNVMGITEVITDPSGALHIIAGKSRIKNTAEWEQNMDKIRAWAAQFGVAIPFPNEVEL